VNKPRGKGPLSRPFVVQMTYQKLYNVLGQLYAILTRALSLIPAHVWELYVLEFVWFLWQMSHLRSRVALLRFRNTEIIPKQPLQKVC